VSRVHLGTRGRRWSYSFSGGIGKGGSPYRQSVKTNGSPFEAHVSSCASYAGAGEGRGSYLILFSKNPDQTRACAVNSHVCRGGVLHT
jgi:hypothetical protein